MKSPLFFKQRSTRRFVLALLFLGTTFSLSSRCFSQFAPAIISTPDKTTPKSALNALNWLEGTWRLKTETTEIQSHVVRSASGNYLYCFDRIRLEDSTKWFGVFRIIFWNPISELFNESIFFQDGSVGNASWEQYDVSWVVATKIILANGRSVTSVNVFTPTRPTGFSWRSESRTVDGFPLPDLGPITAEAIEQPDLKSWTSDLPIPPTVAADE